MTKEGILEMRKIICEEVTKGHSCVGSSCPLNKLKIGIDSCEYACLRNLDETEKVIDDKGNNTERLDESKYQSWTFPNNPNDFENLLKENDVCFFKDTDQLQKSISFSVKTSKDNIVMIYRYNRNTTEISGYHFTKMFYTHCGDNGWYEMLGSVMRAATLASQFTSITVNYGKNIFKFKDENGVIS